MAGSGGDLGSPPGKEYPSGAPKKALWEGLQYPPCTGPLAPVSGSAPFLGSQLANRWAWGGAPWTSIDLLYVANNFALAKEGGFASPSHL